MRRYLNDIVTQDLARKMVWLAGPRQVGKTTLAKQLLPDPAGYLNWDVPEHRAAVLSRTYPPCPMLVFDEIHKYRRWRDYLKGFCDGVGARYRTLVTGSARLDAYKHGGDSLQGRYHFHRLLPLTADELVTDGQEGLRALFTLGGFPEPFLSGSETEARRWTREYRHLLVNEEIPSLEDVTDLGSLQLLAMRLPELVGSPLSLNALREDLQVAHKTVCRWMGIFERLYMVFRIPPFGAPAIRAVKKEQKHYFLDWNTIADDGARFENLLAVHLLKVVFRAQDEFGLDWELRYFRDRDGREVDFVLCDRRRPLLAVEAKLQDRPPAPALAYLRHKIPGLRAIQVAFDGTRRTVSGDGVESMPMLDFARLDLIGQPDRGQAGQAPPGAV